MNYEKNNNTSVLMAIILPLTSIKADSVKHYYTEDNIRDAGGLEKFLEYERQDMEKSLIKYELPTINNNNPIVYTASSVGDDGVHHVDSVGPNYFLTDTRSGYFINYNIYRQDTIYYCGPASIKIALNIINGTSQSQSYYANRMGTGTGTSVFQMSNELNAHQSKNNYGVRTLNYKGTEDSIWEPVITDLMTLRVPLIAQVDTEGLSVYGGKSLGHFVTIIGYHGYSTPSMTKRLDYADSFYGDYGNGSVFGQHSDTLTKFTKATKYLVW